MLIAVGMAQSLGIWTTYLRVKYRAWYESLPLKIFHLRQGFLIVLSAGPEKHIDFLRGPLGFQLLHTLCYRAAQNETQISFLPC